MMETEQKSISILIEAREYVDKNITGRESFSAALSRLLLEHKEGKK